VGPGRQREEDAGEPGVGGGLTSGARWQAGGGRAGLDSGERTGPGLLSARGWLGRSGGVARSRAEGWRAGWAAREGRGRSGLGLLGWGGVLGSFPFLFLFLFYF